jgi:hypothetical protein
MTVSQTLVASGAKLAPGRLGIVVTAGDRKVVTKNATPTVTGTACDALAFLGCDSQSRTAVVIAR